MATFDDVGARVICGGLHPDHSTVAEFVRRNTGAVLALLPESVKACAREGLVSLELVAGDGTKLKANAAMAANLTREQLDAQISELEAWIDAELRQLGPGHAGRRGHTAPAGAAPLPATAAAPVTAAAAGRGNGRRSRTGPRRCWSAAWPPAPGWTPCRTRTRGNSTPGSRSWPPGSRGRKPPSANGRRRPPPGSRPAPPRSPPGSGSGGARPVAPPARTATSSAPGRPSRKTRADYQAARREAAAPAADPEGQGQPHRPVQPRHAAEEGRLRPAVQRPGPRHRQDPGHPRHHPPSQPRRRPGPAAPAGRSPPGPARRRHHRPDPQGPVRRRVRQRRQLHRRHPRKALRRRHPRGPPDRALPGRPRAPGHAPQLGRNDRPPRHPRRQELYRQRAATIEPVFAQLTARLGRTLHYRGSAADAELALWAASHNILKAITARGQAPCPQAGTATAAVPAAA